MKDKLLIISYSINDVVQYLSGLIHHKGYHESTLRDRPFIVFYMPEQKYRMERDSIYKCSRLLGFNWELYSGTNEDWNRKTFRKTLAFTRPNMIFSPLRIPVHLPYSFFEYGSGGNVFYRLDGSDISTKKKCFSIVGLQCDLHYEESFICHKLLLE